MSRREAAGNDGHSPFIGVLAEIRLDPTPTTFVPTAYLAALTDVGASPFIVPVEIDLDTVLEHLDGVLLVGGSDIEPSLYGADRHPRTGTTFLDRDVSEMAIVQGAIERRIPVFGICRGSQMMNVALGGTLVQHLDDLVDGSVHNAPGGPARHPVSAVAGTRLAGVIGTAAIDVPSTHHQAVDSVGSGLVVAAHALDGTIEGIELPGAPFFLGVQWHPELDDDRRLFTAFVEAAAASR